MNCKNCNKIISEKNKSGLCFTCINKEKKGKKWGANLNIIKKSKFTEIVGEKKSELRELEEKEMFGFGKKREVKTMTIGCVKCGWKQEATGTDEEFKKLRAYHVCKIVEEVLPVPLPPVEINKSEELLDEDGYMQLPTRKEVIQKDDFPISSVHGDIPDLLPKVSNNNFRIYYLEKKLETIEEILRLGEK